MADDANAVNAATDDVAVSNGVVVAEEATAADDATVGDEAADGSVAAEEVAADDGVVAGDDVAAEIDVAAEDGVAADDDVEVDAYYAAYNKAVAEYEVRYGAAALGNYMASAWEVAGAVKPNWSMGVIAHKMAEYVVHALPLPADSPLRARFAHTGDAAKHEPHTSCEPAARASTMAAALAAAASRRSAAAAAAAAAATVTTTDAAATVTATEVADEATASVAITAEAAAASLVDDGVGVALLTHHADDGGTCAATTWDALTALAVAAPGSAPMLVSDGVAVALRTIVAPSTPLPVTAAALHTLAAVCGSPAGAVALDDYGAMHYAASLSTTLTQHHAVPVSAASALHGVYCLVAALSRGLVAAGRTPDWSELEVAAVAVTAMRAVSAAATHRAACGEDAAKEMMAALAAWPRFAGIVATAGATPDALSSNTPCEPRPSVMIVPPPRTKPHATLPPADFFKDEACVARAAARVAEACAHLGRVPPDGVPAGMLVGILSHFPDNEEVLPAVFRAVVACGAIIGDKQKEVLAGAVLNALPVIGGSHKLASNKGTVDAYLSALGYLLPHLPYGCPKKLRRKSWKQLADVVEPYTSSVDTAALAVTAMAAAATRQWRSRGRGHPVLECLPIVVAALAACEPTDAAPLVAAATSLLVAIAANHTAVRIAGRFADPILTAAGVVGPQLSPATVAALLSVADLGNRVLAAPVVVLLGKAYHRDSSVMQSCSTFVHTMTHHDAGAVLAAAGCGTLLWDALRDHGLHAIVVALEVLAASLTPAELTPPGACHDLTAAHCKFTTAEYQVGSSARLLALQLGAWEGGTAADLPEVDAAEACRALLDDAMTMPYERNVMLPALAAAKAWATRGIATVAPDLCNANLWYCVTVALDYHTDDDTVIAAALELMVTLGPATWDTMPDAEAIATASTLLVAAVRHPNFIRVPAAVAVLQQLAAASPTVRRHLWRVNAAVSLPALAGCMLADNDDTSASPPPPAPPPTWQAAMQRMAAGAGGDPSPALVLLSSGVVLHAAVLQWLEPADARQLRVCHPAMAAAVAEQVWDATARCNRVARGGGGAWARSMPAAWTVRLPGKSTAADMHALGGMKRLARVCIDDTADATTITLLPRTISTLHVAASLGTHNLAHLTALETLILHHGFEYWCEGRLQLPASLKHCYLLCAEGLDWAHLGTLPLLLTLVLRRGAMSPAAVTALPHSLQSLDLTGTIRLNVAGASFAHLAALRHVVVARTDISDAVLATMPAGVLTLDVSRCEGLTSDVTFCHMGALVALRADCTSVSDATLAEGIPPSVVLLSVSGCGDLTDAATCAALPALRHLDVSKTAVGAAMLASLPVGLCDLDVSGCDNVDGTARLSHLPRLRAFACAKTSISDAAIASCPPTLRYLRAAGCRALTDALDLAHLLPELAALDASDTSVGDGMLRRLPPSLQRLELADTKLTPAAVLLPPLPQLTCVTVSRTAIGVPFLASLPPCVAHLNVAGCSQMRNFDTVTAWKSLIDSGALDRMAECHVHTDDEWNQYGYRNASDGPPSLRLLAASLGSRGIALRRAACHSCAAPFPKLLWPKGHAVGKWHWYYADPFGPGFENSDDYHWDEYDRRNEHAYDDSYYGDRRDYYDSDEDDDGDGEDNGNDGEGGEDGVYDGGHDGEGDEGDNGDYQGED